MEEKCLKCHVATRATDYFCYNCGNNLKPTPPSISAQDQIILYIKSVLLPPFGVLWAIKYLKQSDNKSRMVGVVAIILTLISFVISIMWFQSFMNDVNTQLSEQMSAF